MTSPVPTTVTVITGITYAFFLYLLVATAVERTIEILMAVFKYLELRRDWYGFWNERAKALQRYLDRIYAFNAIHPNEPDNQLSRLLWRVMVPTAAGRRDVIAADLIRSKILRVGSGFVALVLSLLIVNALNIDPKPILQQIVPDLPKIGFFAQVAGWRAVRMLLLAAAISAGTEPLHHLIGRIEEHIKDRTAKQKGGAA